MSKDNNNSILYRFLRVIFYTFSISILFAVFYFANEKANSTVQVLDEKRTYKAIGEVIRKNTKNGTDTTNWKNESYPNVFFSDDETLGEYFYKNKENDPNLLSLWINSPNRYKYEFFDESEKYSVLGKLKIYMQYIGTTLFFLYTLKRIGKYVLFGENLT